MDNTVKLQRLQQQALPPSSRQATAVAEWMPCLFDLANMMIKIKSYIVIAFSYRKANKLRKWSEILHFCYGNKGLCHCCRSH